MNQKNHKRRGGYQFTLYQEESKTPFEKLFDIFKELITHTSGDLDEALDWLEQLDQEYNLTNEEYTLDDFVEDLKKRGYIREEIKPDLISEENGHQKIPGCGAPRHGGRRSNRSRPKLPKADMVPKGAPGESFSHHEGQAHQGAHSKEKGQELDELL